MSAGLSTLLAALPSEKHRSRNPSLCYHAVVALPEFVAARAKKAFDKYCAARNTPDIRDKIRLIYKVRGSKITLIETRPPWDDPDGEWTQSPVARFCFDQTSGSWTIKWRDRNQRFHVYDLLEPDPDIEKLLREVERDPTHIFWG